MKKKLNLKKVKIANLNHSTLSASQLGNVKGGCALESNIIIVTTNPSGFPTGGSGEFSTMGNLSSCAVYTDRMPDTTPYPNYTECQTRIS
ncbi:hypothetical protein HZP84_15560 [Elizabethkingia anophelis]|uniref:Uncharacterized protein n=1 Tax=Elizabethkingia anophelis TaxID=1117645 RepID=A0A6I5V090_9FLAO|nr:MULTISPECIES: hypothetical protein [Elizabethkingia]MCT3631867.1 hypothetical protein [Elizabethkingia anophelis]MCT3635381.1 hypothetical protein [Elizabethkingia anophelis]MCT3674891.1 hypothetical protein [Elizabethkingia anophelis]MCT3682411.1 hypothetical protein [Elizabethkingia anophelis]MCT3692377.1 hypothetical protein [Elizabethkingia anophelis]